MACNDYHDNLEIIFKLTVRFRIKTEYSINGEIIVLGYSAKSQIECC